MESYNSVLSTEVRHYASELSDISAEINRYKGLYGGFGDGELFGVSSGFLMPDIDSDSLMSKPGLDDEDLQSSDSLDGTPQIDFDPRTTGLNFMSLHTNSSPLRLQDYIQGAEKDKKGRSG